MSNETQNSSEQSPTTPEQTAVEAVPAPKTPGEVAIATITGHLDKYIAEMAPARPISDEDGALNQYRLWMAIKHTLTLKGPDFVRAYTTLLNYVKQHRQGVFAERYVYRVFNTSRIQGDDSKRFTRVLNLLLSTADPATRQHGLKQISLKTTFDGWPGDVIMKVEEFYSV